MEEIRKVLQIMPADNYWIVHKCHVEDVCFYKKVFFFLLIEISDGDGVYNAVEPVDSDEEFDYLNDLGKIYELRNFICLYYSKELYEEICIVCCKLHLNCSCGGKAGCVSKHQFFENKFLEKHKEAVERKKKVHESLEKIKE